MSKCPMQNWRILYRAAILEKDESLIPKRISDAEKAILSRGRELLCNSGTVEERDGIWEERDQIDDALYALRAYRTAREHVEEAA